MSSKKPKTTVISLRVSIEQREAIETAAVTAGASVSGFVAATMADAMSRKQGPSRASLAPSVEMPPTRAAGISLTDPATLAELKRIGININQLAHAANAGYPPNVTALIDSFKQLLTTLSEPEAFKRHIAQTKARLHAPTPPAPTPKLPPRRASLTGDAAAARPAPRLPTRAVAPKPEAPSPRLPQSPKPQSAVKDDRREAQHPQSRNQLQSRPELRPPRPAEGDGRAGRLGIFRKLWDR